MAADPFFQIRPQKMSAMQPTHPIEKLIPHRGRMRLIDTIVSIDKDHAVTQSTVGPNWPLMTAGGANPIILIELAAQTAGVCLGWSELEKSEVERGKTGGWLVGIKQAHFSIDRIPVNTRITIQSETKMAVDQYKEIAATAGIDGNVVGEIQLQVLQAGKTAFSE